MARQKITFWSTSEDNECLSKALDNIISFKPAKIITVIPIEYDKNTTGTMYIASAIIIYEEEE
jgi:hypothetical protein